MSASLFLDHYKELWHQCSGEFPGFLKAYAVEEKMEKEQIFSEFTGRFNARRESFTLPPGKKEIRAYFPVFGDFMKRVYDYDDAALSIIMHPGFIDSSLAFYRETRRFDPVFKKENIYQAMRNVWIMNGLQLLLNKKIELSPSVFAYSLLYPYTDNLLDDPSITPGDKVDFCNRLGASLKGYSRLDSSQNELKIARLLGMIWEQYPPENFPAVHESIYAIHEAQFKSLELENMANKSTEAVILEISFHKGGTSVLADGFLAGANLSEEEQRFFYGFGIWLQLLDDIQDLREDTASGTFTLFTSQNATDRAALTNQTIHFGREVIKEIENMPSGISALFGEVILKSLELMLIQSVGINSGFYPRSYCRNLEKYAPLRFTFLKDAQKKGAGNRAKNILQWMDAWA